MCCGGDCWQTLSVLECAMACSGVGLHDLRQWDGWVRLHSRTQGRARRLTLIIWAHALTRTTCVWNFVQTRANFSRHPHEPYHCVCAMSDGAHYCMITAFYCIPQRGAEESRAAWGNAVSLRERGRAREREREGPLCPPETRKGIELICWCLVSAYGALNSRDS